MGFLDFTNKNNLLRMAGMSTTSTLLNQIPGATLKMQRELQWFKVIYLTLNFLVFYFLFFLTKTIVV